MKHNEAVKKNKLSTNLYGKFPERYQVRKAGRTSLAIREIKIKRTEIPSHPSQKAIIKKKNNKCW
jgi:hypothetical protein